MTGSTTPAGKVTRHPGPRRLLYRDGAVVITLGRWLPAAPTGNPFVGAAAAGQAGEYFASALGWGSCLVATGRDRAAVVAHCRERFPGCVIEPTGDAA